MSNGISTAIQEKLARVPIHIAAIQRCVDVYSANHGPKLISDFQGNKAALDMPTPPPVEIAVLAGEAIYQMRSALDHLVFDLVKLNPNKANLPAKWDKYCEFPICTELPDSQMPPLPYGFFANLPGITTEAHDFIESVQPYYGVGRINNCLRFLNELCNIDKHRHLALTRMRAQMYEHRVMASGLISTGHMPLDHGTEFQIFENAGDAIKEIEVQLSPFVTFAEPTLGDACVLSVQELLQTILDEMNSVIVPAFARFLN